MKNLFYGAMLFLLIGANIHAQKKVEYPTGIEDSLYSEILKETRYLWVYVPPSFPIKTAEKKYPVMFLLDAGAQFPHTTQTLRYLSQPPGSVPEQVVVGIHNTNRTRDLTPTHINEMYGDSVFVKPSGGGDTFLEFMEKELIPYVEKKYPVSTYRTFTGHSLGGLTTVYAMGARPHLFRNYISFDPTLPWDDHIAVKTLEKALAKGSLKGKSLYIISAVKENQPDPDARELDESFMAPLKETEALLKNANEVNFTWINRPDYNHADIPALGTVEAVRKIFSWHTKVQEDIFLATDPRLNKFPDPNDMVAEIKKLYKSASKNLGFEVKPDEMFINQLGYWFMGDGHLDKAEAIFQMNIENYPESANVHDSMAEFLIANNRTEEAKKHLEIALSIDNNPSSRQKLEQLTATSKEGGK